MCHPRVPSYQHCCDLACPFPSALLSWGSFGFHSPVRPFPEAAAPRSVLCSGGHSKISHLELPDLRVCSENEPIPAISWRKARSSALGAALSAEGTYTDIAVHSGPESHEAGSSGCV